MSFQPKDFAKRLDATFGESAYDQELAGDLWSLRLDFVGVLKDIERFANVEKPLSRKAAQKTLGLIGAAIRSDGPIRSSAIDVERGINKLLYDEDGTQGTPPAS